MLSASLIAFVSLTLIQVAVAVTYKLSSVSGHYNYSPSSSLAISEAFKCSLSVILFTVNYQRTRTAVETVGPWEAFRNHLTRKLFWSQFGLAVLYVINNNLAFYLYLDMDPASINIFKTPASFIAAVILTCFGTRVILPLEWISVVLQVLGLFVIQWNACTGSVNIPILDLGLATFSTFLTSFASVWNEILIKEQPQPLNVQNFFLYIYGFVLNVLCFLFLPPPGGQSVGFFAGYTGAAIGVVICNSLIGLAITAVYKYANVIVKTFSSAVTNCLLLVLSYFFFQQNVTATSFAGALIVVLSTYLFFNPGPKPTLATAPSAPGSPPVSGIASYSTSNSTTRAEFRSPATSNGRLFGGEEEDSQEEDSRLLGPDSLTSKSELQLTTYPGAQYSSSSRL